MRATRLGRVPVLQAGGFLAGHGIVNQVRHNQETGYRKDPWITANKGKILRRIGRVPRGAVQSSRSTLAVGRAKPEGRKNKASVPKAIEITVDDIDNFRRVRRSNKAPTRQRPPLEQWLKSGFQRMIGEPGKYADWGGEKNDLYTTRLEIRGRRYRAAFAFKGRGKKGVLTPAQLGKNGDQIQRLFESPGQVFLVQYWGRFHQAVPEQMRVWAQKRARDEGVPIYYCTIDGTDTARLICAYPRAFGRQVS